MGLVGSNKTMEWNGMEFLLGVSISRSTDIPTEKGFKSAIGVGVFRGHRAPNFWATINVRKTT